jgi:hypothetical protein
VSFLRTLKGVFNSEIMGEEIVKSIIDLFYMTEKYNPGDNRHDLMAKTYIARLSARRIQFDENSIVSTALSKTTIFATLPEGHDVKALALHMLFEERPDIVHQYPKFEQEYKRLMAPAFD